MHALRLRRAASGSSGQPQEVGRAFLESWRDDTSVHFRKEEEVLLAVVAIHAAELLEDEPITRMLVQHSCIRGLAMKLGEEIGRRNLQPETLRRIGELLEAHIRLEEREVFPLIEEALSESALKQVSEQLTAFEAGELIAKPLTHKDESGEERQ